MYTDPAVDFRFSGLVLTPGAGATRDSSGLVAIDRRLSELGIDVERVEFPGQTARSRRPDAPDVCAATIRTAATALARRLDLPIRRIAIGGRSFGGRMCSMTAANGLDVAALVLVSYPLHPPRQPDRLRTSHFPNLDLPCLFVSGRRDPFGSPEEFERETAAIPGDVTLMTIDGDHSLRKQELEASEVIATWATTR
jgi:hypothetical protein